MRNHPRANAEFGPTVMPLASPAAPSSPRRSPLWWVALYAAASALLIAAALWLLRAEAIRGGEQLARALAGLIAEQTTRSLQSVHQRLEMAGHTVQDRFAEGSMDEEAGRALLRERARELPYVTAMWVLGADGRMVLDSNVGNVGRDLASRAYFAAHRRGAPSPPYLSPLERSVVTGRWQITASLAMRGPGGELEGVIAAAIEPAHFQSVWAGLNLGRDGTVALLHARGQLMMRSPADDAVLGADLSDVPLFTHWLPQAPSGLFHGRSSIDDIERVVAYERLPLYPQFLVTVGSSHAHLLAPWRRFASLTAVVWLLSVLGSAALALQLRRHSARREHLEQRFRQLAQAMPQIVFMTDAHGVIDFVSERWSEETGLPTGQAVGARWQDLAHPDDAPGVGAAMEQALAAGEPLQAELRLSDRDGNERWHLLRAVPNRGAGGEVVSWYGTSTDVHDLKLAQQQLQHQADTLRLAGELARLGTWELDVASGRFTLSDIAARTLDLPPGSTPTLQDLYARMGPRGGANAAEILRRCVEQGETFDLEGRLQTRDGQTVWVRSIGQPVRDASGRVVRVQGAQQDVTQRVQMLARIRELNATLEERIAQRTRELGRQEALFRTLAEQAPMPIWTVDPEGRVTFLSRAWYQIAGGEPPKWTGLEWLDLIHPDDLPEVRSNWARSRREGGTYQGMRRIRSRSGTFHTTSYRATPVRGEDGQIAFWVGVDADVTELVANEAALRLANEQLRSFSYSVSHDLQSPLQRIGTFAQLLRAEIGPSYEGTRAGHFLGRIVANVEEMVQLVQGLLSLAQVSQADVVRGRVDLSAIATEILERLQAESPARKVRWQVEPGLAVLGDVRLMRSVMENLVGNAWKFTSRVAGAEITVGGSAGRGEFFVRDNGAGFDMAHADKLFGTFQRLHLQSEFPGTGIGLATVARAVQRQGGSVWAEAEPGRGATFRFSMPVPPPA